MAQQAAILVENSGVEVGVEQKRAYDYIDLSYLLSVRISKIKLDTSSCSGNEHIDYPGEEIISKKE